MFGDLYLLCAEQHRWPCYVSAWLPLLLMARRGSCRRDGGGYLHVLNPVSDAALPIASLATQQGPAQPLPVCVS